MTRPEEYLPEAHYNILKQWADEKGIDIGDFEGKLTSEQNEYYNQYMEEKIKKHLDILWHYNKKGPVSDKPYRTIDSLV